ncbi:MAG: HlyD family efflux transporter periplasmic adaptor subunit [Deltaproteobacteria bacterium]|nr:HlyD family efflux transporter periplasmic adaptor subunit [Deltaproteobacteria bacterium]
MDEAPTYLPVDEPATMPRKCRVPKSDSVITSAPRAAREPAPLPPAPSIAAPQSPVVQLPGGGAAFDPHGVPLPAELAPNIYGWLRRLALQADLAGADRLLRDALADLTSSLSVVLIYAGPEGLHSLGTDDEIPQGEAQQPIQAVARSRRALVTTHVALVPITTQSETICVIQLTRNPRQAPFGMLEHVLMAAIARESAGIMHHLVVEHLQRRTEAEQDKKSLYRPEALDSHRRRGHEGVVAELSPGWVRRTYYVLGTIMVIAVVFSVVIKVPTYSTGTGVVIYQGTPVTSPSPGQVEKIYAEEGQKVLAGDLIVKLSSEKEDADLRAAKTAYEKAQAAYFMDKADETARKEIVETQNSYTHAQAAVDQKTIRAKTEGTVSGLHLTRGQAVQFGDPICSIVPEGTAPEIWAFMPGSDRPRVHAGMPLQVEISGYQKGREKAEIYEVGREITGAASIRATLGPQIADSLKLPQDGSFVIVKAKLPTRTFEVDHKTYRYFHGLGAKTEVRVESKRFLVTLLPSLDKYL